MHGSNPSTRWIATAVALLVAVGGCSREQFRQRADLDVEGVISQKNLFPDWKVENWHVYPDSRARFADPSCPDYPPYPPDDYAAWLTSPNPQHPGRGGAGRYEGDGYLQILRGWDAQNRAEDAAADAREALPALTGGISGTDPGDPTVGGQAVAGAVGTYLQTFVLKDQPLRIRVDQAAELAILNAREFQDRREDLYLAALPVTLERYSFAAQAFASEQVIRDSLGREAPGGPGERWRINTDAGISREFATGATLIVRLANQVVVDLTGNQPYLSLSNLSLTFIQPFLRGGGYAVTLEALTQSERTLVYAIRSFARFRKVFYATIVGTGGYTNNPYGLQGLSTNLGRGIGANLTSQPVGYLPTTLQGAVLANGRKNVASLEQILKLFQNLREGGVVSELQVNQVEQQLINSRTNVLNQTQQYLSNLDLFKLQLGLPTTVPLELDDGPLKPVRQQVQRFDRLYAQFEEVTTAAGRYDAAEAPAQYRERWVKLLTESALARGTAFANDFPALAARLRALTDEALAARQAEFSARRQKLLDARTDRQAKNIEETPAQIAELVGVEDEIDRLRFERALRRYEARPWLGAIPARRAADQALAFQAAFESGTLVAAQVRTQRLDAIRAAWPALPTVAAGGIDLIRAPLDDAYGMAAREALNNRLDLMNARAQVVDGWRQVTVAANALKGALNVQYDLNANTPAGGDNGLAFAGPRTNHAVTLRYDPPFVRRAERNQYRATLIQYQRSRRNLMAFEDNVLSDARQDVRNLRNLAGAYALQQRAVELGYATVDNARATLVAPPDPQDRSSAGNVAALTQQLLQAQNSLLQAQNTLYTTWTNYQTARLELFLDLELLPLDARGIWTDEPLSQPVGGPPGPDRVPVPERAPAPQPVPGR